ncbi:MAG TPA: alpha/beta hydrolase, partial [Marinilabiliaceae bacterium]|nr:alpha/beta hydrolase [Marinilabiliaceae bacterium]
CITIKDIPYRQTKQQILRADVFIPNSGRVQYGSVLLVHGGGWISGSKENLTPLAQRLAENGYVAVSVNYSLSTVAQFPAAVIDLKAAIKWMRAHSNEFKIDPERIAILGASAGAQLATLVGVSASNPMFFDGNKEFNDKVQGVINIDGITSFIHPDARESEIAGKWLGGLQDENFNNWRLASALEYVDNNSPPILFVNSSQDRFHAGRDDMISKLNSYQIYSEVHTLQQSPHSFWLVHPWFQPTLNHCLEFLDKIW